MKKTMQLLLISILATVLLFSVTVLVSQTLMERVYKSSYNTSSVYKVVDFTPPNKTVYTLDEINSYIPNDDTIVATNHTLKQEIDFDGEGMAMTIEDKNGNIKTYEYTCDYFEIDGQTLKCEDYFLFDFNADKYLNEYGLLEEGICAANIILITDDGECLTHEFDFSIVTVPKNEKETHSPTQPQTEAQVPTQPKTETQEPTEDSNLVIPKLKKHWNNANEMGQHIQITHQNGNELTLLITKFSPDSGAVSTQVSVELNNVYINNGEIKGVGTFNYIDSLAHYGGGRINVSKHSITIDMKCQYASGAWCVNSFTGKYI